MNRINDNSYHYNVTEDRKFYFNMEDDKRPIFTPVFFYNCEESGFLKYSQGYRQRYHTSYTYIMSMFSKGSNSVLELFKIKEKQFYCSQGCIFRLEVGEDTISHLNPIVITCFDENTNWDSEKGFKFFISSSELELEHNKQLKPKLLKVIESYKDCDVIYTNDIIKWCFNPKPNNKFKSIKEQREFLENLIEMTV